MGAATRRHHGLLAAYSDVVTFSRAVLPERALRGYQLPAARALAGAVRAGGGKEYVVVFSRQAGKDEVLAQLCAWLLHRYQRRGGTVVVATPALRPQGMLARDRLLDCLRHSPAARRVRVRHGVSVELGRARVRYLSAAPGANSRGNTADLLLVANEAQDIEPDVWDAVFAPMAASSNAATLYMGTVWSSVTLLARQMRLLADLQRQDGERRMFRVAWQEVAQELPAYGAYVRRQMALLGEQHPFIRTEYALEELDGGGRLFPIERRELLRGSFPGCPRPAADDPPGVAYAFTIDVAGEEEDGLEGAAARAANPRRDATALNVVRVLPPRVTAVDRRPHYQVVARAQWVGTRHTLLLERIVALARIWQPRHVIIDATGVGAGLAGFLRAALGERVVTPFIFSSASKSRLAWELLALIDAGRLQVFQPSAGSDPEQVQLDLLFQRQLAACRYTTLPGPGRLVRWGVDDPHLHDDLLLATALIAELDRRDWRPREARGR
ncbi:MAG: hypothetical protein DCC58_07095 [Chloroflexi bacterium]|nr:MAG: hypothetical protein DCC58_07095 [Chloroflexota bacterium]